MLNHQTVEKLHALRLTGMADAYRKQMEDAEMARLTLGIVVGIMMVCYVAIPSRLIGMKTTFSKRDKLAASVVGGAVGAG